MYRYIIIGVICVLNATVCEGQRTARQVRENGAHNHVSCCPLVLFVCRMAPCVWRTATCPAGAGWVLMARATGVCCLRRGRQRNCAIALVEWPRLWPRSSGNDSAMLRVGTPQAQADCQLLAALTANRQHNSDLAANWQRLCLHTRRRYKLIAERPGRPQGDALDYLISQALNPEGGAEGGDAGKPADFLQQLQRTVTSMQRFMKSLSN